MYTAARNHRLHVLYINVVVYKASSSEYFLIFLLFMFTHFSYFLIRTPNHVYTTTTLSVVPSHCIYGTYASLGDLFPCLIDRKVASSRLLFIYYIRVFMYLLRCSCVCVCFYTYSFVSYQGHKPTLF